MATVLNFTGDFSIVELTGEKRTIQLRARGLPQRPYTLEGEQRGEATWFAGNPIASPQLLGAQEKPSTIKGRWSDMYLGDTDIVSAERDGTPIRTARHLADLFDDVRKKGQIVEVVWLHLTRHGWLRNFKQTWQTVHDVEWEMTFEYISQGEVNKKLGAARREFDMSQVEMSFEGDVVQLSDASISPFARAQAFADALDDKISAVQSSLDEFSQSVVTYVTGAMAPVDAVRRAVGLLDFVSTTCNEIIAKVFEQTDAASVSIDDISQLSPGQVLAAVAANRAVVHQARVTRHNAAQRRYDATRSLDPELIDAFFAAQDQDLRDVSRIYYGVSDHWYALMQYNELSSSRLSSGQLVMVPKNLKGIAG